MQFAWRGGGLFMKKQLYCALTSTLLFVLAIQGCGKAKTEKEESNSEETGFVTADNPNARISETLKRIKGRWVEEIPSTIKPNIPTMRIYAVADNTLQGRFLVAGGYADQGVEITIREDNGTFTLNLRDDELRPHAWIPAERLFTGTWNAAEQTFEFKSDSGEWIRWKFPSTADRVNNFRASYSASVFTCKITPAPSPGPLPVPTPSGGNGGGGGDNDDDNGGGGGDDDSDDSALHLNLLVADPTPAPTPMPRMGEICGVMTRHEVDWSRMSGSE